MLSRPTTLGEIIRCPPFAHRIACKCIYYVKVKSDGSLDRYKARVVALGNFQEYDNDSDETFALVAKVTWVRTSLVIAPSQT